MIIVDRLKDMAVIVRYIDTIVPYIINCNGYDNSVVTSYNIRFKKKQELPNNEEIKSLKNLLVSIPKTYENSLLLTEFDITLDEIRREINEN